MNNLKINHISLTLMSCLLATVILEYLKYPKSDYYIFSEAMLIIAIFDLFTIFITKFPNKIKCLNRKSNSCLLFTTICFLILVKIIESVLYIMGFSLNVSFLISIWLLYELVKFVIGRISP